MLLTLIDTEIAILTISIESAIQEDFRHLYLIILCVLTVVMFKQITLELKIVTISAVS